MVFSTQSGSSAGQDLGGGTDPVPTVDRLSMDSTGGEASVYGTGLGEPPVLPRKR